MLDLLLALCYNINMRQINNKNIQFQFEVSRDGSDYFHVEKYVSDGYYAHFHRNPELYCVFSGSSRVTVNGREIALTAGDAVFINSLQIHSYECDDKAEVAFALLGTDYMQSFYNLYPNHFLPTLLSDKQGNIQLFNLIETLSPKRCDFTGLERVAYTNLILHLIVSVYGTVPEQQKGGKGAYVLSEIIQYIYDHFSEDLSLTSIAEHFGYAPLTISKMFSQYIKIDIRNFINSVRIQKVFELRQLPEYEGKSMLELSSLCGFNSVSRFYRAYKKSLNTHAIKDSNNN